MIKSIGLSTVSSQDKASYRLVLKNSLPLLATWMMMAVEGPFLAAVMARLPFPKENLAAFGISFSLGLLLEAPIIMLMAASLRLVLSLIHI